MHDDPRQGHAVPPASARAARAGERDGTSSRRPGYFTDPASRAVQSTAAIAQRG
ncbi:hypothetical protein [Mycobacterium sp. 29Ha]|uniref:hypothetical protein n=1 Tax=Mycobacterium sp. 29Ha TaxID=2939268 RepID=UPI0029391A71|nr:hypothetical protein [Mycobacterium sp. 29Ha]MDV3133343.1 hypothetical protein [Mycobacterium sp. 29Ha]